MKLKSITIHGFKSFADRVTIHYHDGITGVIGPNGSGKSNIIDAVRWVMGEQTAKSLRADDPTDIIFAGSQSRKHMGMATVKLTFANTGINCPPEFLHLSEISIERRISRSGERDYLMNGEECRFKDIVEFLLSIGLGSKSYSIIQQEKRDRIIQANPEEMREILEEAAGISAFKARRKEAEKRLDSTAEKVKSLVEIENELTRNRENLKEQVEKAQQKAVLSAELREKEVAIIRDRVGFLRSKANALELDIASKRMETERKTVESTEWETDANELEITRLELAQQVKNLRDKYEDKRLAATKLKERKDFQIRTRDERILRKQNLAKEMSEERVLADEEEAKLSGVAGQLQEAESQFSKLDASIETLQIQMEEIEETLQVEHGRGEEMRSQIRATQELISNLRTRNESGLTAIQKANEALKKHDESLQEQAQFAQQINADRKGVEASLALLSNGLENVATEKNRKEAELGALEGDLQIAQKNRDESKQHHMELTSSYNSLQALVAGGDGLSDGTRFLRDSLSHKLSGFLYEKMSLHRDDEALFERALPDLLQSAMIDNMDSLLDILDKAEEQGLTRIGLLVRELLVPLSPDEKDAAQKIAIQTGLRCVGARAERVEVPEIKNLLERIFIARDEWLIVKALRECPQSMRSNFMFISERGTLFAPGRELGFGDSNGQNSGILHRKRALQDISIQKENAQAALAQSEGALYIFAERQKLLRTEIAQLESRLSQERVESVKLSGELKNFDTKLYALEQNVSRLETDREAAKADIASLREQFSRNQDQIDMLEKEKIRFQRDMDDFESELLESRERRNEISDALNRRKQERSVLTERQSNLRTHYEQMRNQVNRLRDKVDKGLAHLSELDSQISDFARELEMATFELTGLDKDQVTLNDALNHAVDEEARTQEEYRMLESRLRTQRDTAQAAQKILSEKGAELAQVGAFLETALKDAYERLGIIAKDLPESGVDDPSAAPKLESRIRKIKVEIEELGPVNERALEEFNDVEDRLNFLINQKADIERSADELRQSIAEIEETTKSRFKIIFDEVSNHFKNIFPILFPGGHGVLNLLKPDELLTTGVEILVQLPGKKQQNMSLFSGGEKALTAISLIFSLLKTTPAPFCFLDEVDAPLDEANVGRFNDILEALSDQFQFVVITHNRRTMEVLDTIYGISMAEPGVSKLVAVDLTEVPAHLRKKDKRPLNPNATSSAIGQERIGASLG